MVPVLLRAGGQRVTGLHYGTYDYSASCGVAAAQQSLEHPVADFAKGFLQLAAADAGVLVSDGSSNVLPIGDRDAVHAAWRLHARLVRRSLDAGLYQGGTCTRGSSSRDTWRPTCSSARAWIRRSLA